MERKGSYLVEEDGMIELGNRSLSIRINTARGLQPVGLGSRRASLEFADRPYLYRSRGTWETPAFMGSTSGRKGRDLELLLEGEIGPVRLRQEFRVPPSQPWVDEVLTIENRDSSALDAPDLAMGFAHSMEGQGDVPELKIAAVPFRRDLRGSRGEYQEYCLREIPINRGRYCPTWPQRVETKELGAEGWIWTTGKSSLLVAKHSPELIEFSVISPEKVGGEEVLRFGGASIWHGDPEEAASLGPGESFTFSVTRYLLVDGGLKEGYYAFRDYMDSMGHGTPKGFNPPIHWNELYDNPLWWGEDNYRRRRELYDLPHIEEEAAKAREIGCESLYLDPGWDTSFGSSIWPPYRLLEAGDFVQLMRRKYGLGVSLHMPLAVWCDATAYPLEAHRRAKDGTMLDSLCSASPAYQRTKRARLLELARAGFVYYMFDGTAFTGECWDPAHGHPLPLTRSEHCKSILKLAQAIHREFPEIIIELHDPVLGGVPERYAPMHYLHGLKGSFDEGWAFEYMWDPMDDLISGRAISLYYYNLAYSMPLYIHIDLRKDNRNALEFWWYASTCRHLGIGGQHRDPGVWKAHKLAMKTYLRLKRHFTQGRFLGIAEDIHLHLLPGERIAVVNAFNLDSKATMKEFSIDLDDLGFPGVDGLSQGNWTTDGKELSVRLPMGGRDAKVVEIVST